MMASVPTVTRGVSFSPNRMTASPEDQMRPVCVNMGVRASPTSLMDIIPM